MKVSRNPSYLFQSRHGIYYFRARIPLFIKSRYNTTKNEVRKSLDTRSLAIARKEARRLWVMMEDTDYMMNIDELEQHLQESNEGRQLLKRFLIASIKSRETGILDGEETDNYFVDYENLESETHILFRQLNSNQIELLKKQLDLWGDEPEDKKKEILLKLKSEIDKEEKEDIVAEKRIVIKGEVGSDAAAHVEEDLFVADAVKLFLDDHVETKSRGNAKGAAASTMVSYKGKLNEFVRIIGGDTVKCSSITKKTIIDYDKNIWKVPSGFTRYKKYKSMSIDEIIAYAGKNNISTKDNETVSQHVMRIKEFLKWLAVQEFVEEGLEKYLKEVPASNKSDSDKKDKFTDDDLRKLFNNEIYEKGRFKNKPSRYWLPLIALFTGMRGQEIAQLFNDDIQYDEEEKIWFIEIRENEKRKQRLKTTQSARKVPVHNKLKDLGFLEYVETVKGSKMLFPELYNEEGNHYKKYGNNFNRKNGGWKVKLGVEGHNSFHSFRHNVIDFLVKDAVDERVVTGLVGQKYKGGVVPNYLKSDALSTRYDALKRLKYPCVDWSKIVKRRW